MPRFLWQVSYTAEGAKGVASEGGTARREAIEAMFAQVGGRLEVFYYAFGADDLIVIGELPDNATAAAFSLHTAESGAARSRATVLLTPAELDEAVGVNVTYVPPGKQSSP